MSYFVVLIAKMITITARTAYRIFLLKADISFWKGDFSSLISSSFPAICPILVCIPVAVTMAKAFPDVIDVPLKISSPFFFFIEFDSPVRVDSSSSKLSVFVNLQSAGITLPFLRLRDLLGLFLLSVILVLFRLDISLFLGLLFFVELLSFFLLCNLERNQMFQI